MRVIIVDDEPKNIEALKLILNAIRKDIEILAEAHSADEALKVIRQFQGKTDVLLLDIQMPKGDGFYLLDQLNTIDFSVIFITAYDQFAIKAIKFSALDYLLKPVDPEELKLALSRHEQKNNKVEISEFATRIHSGKLFDKLAVKTLADVRFISLDQVRYLQSENTYTTIHMDSGEKIVSSKSIGFYEELLTERNFFRCHNSYLINIAKVTRITRGKSKSVELDHKLLLDVSERRRDDLMAILGLS
jgi:two-component system LytT family response regulator